MKLPEFRRTLSCIAAALVVGGAWAFHVAVSAHDAADNDCRVCAVAVSPELNSDCGSVLLSYPVDFTVIKSGESLLPIEQTVVAFYGRAPPVL